MAPPAPTDTFPSVDLLFLLFTSVPTVIRFPPCFLASRPAVEAPISCHARMRPDSPMADRTQRERSRSPRRRSRSPRRSRRSYTPRSRSRSREEYRRSDRRSRSPMAGASDAVGGHSASGYGGRSGYGPSRSFEDRAIAKEQMMQSVRESSQQDRRVYVGNLSYDVKWHHLKDFMRQGEQGQISSGLDVCVCVSVGKRFANRWGPPMVSRDLQQRERSSSPTSYCFRMECRRWGANVHSVAGLFPLWFTFLRGILG